jgi:dTDP-4-dehydrorhamnose reductase
VRVLITGAAGMLGRALVETAPAGIDAAGVDLVDGDLTRPGTARTLCARLRPEWVVHAAAFTDVDGAETRRDEATAVNATATALVGEACAEAGCGLSYVSTDYVFDGRRDGFREDDPRRPLGHYGATKALGEEAVERLTIPWQIVRTAWLFGPGSERNFVRTILRLLDAQPGLKVVDDQVGSPTYTLDLAATIWFLVARRAPGRFHATNAGRCSWHGFARAIAELSGADPERVRPCTSAEFPRPAPRPACSVLLSRNLEALGCPPRPHWRDALTRYLARLRAPGGPEA